ncbi:hypothetical protein BC831DRAFT_444187 [Entophlyctis helioformis]|nr:hypothetical protein BC831DRAFT_444187 [Entophlyctis helioformis]
MGSTSGTTMVADPVRNWNYNAGFFFLVGLVAYASWSQGARGAAGSGAGGNPLLSLASLRRLAQGPWTAFRAFQLNYLTVYSLVFVSDWLQGPYIYALYKSYGFELDAIALLFVMGFLSSAVFGTFVGSIADRFGRKLGSVLFCILYAVSCLTKLSSDFNMLLLGRLLGGISTSLLFSVFESWMVSEHHTRAFDESLLSDTFAWSTFLNGFVAIASGVIANVSVDTFGLVAPFMVSWSENYGNKLASAPSPSFMSVVDTIRKDPKIFAVGTMQFCFESAMYTFVFLWSPVLETATQGRVALPFGVMFSSFMVCIMLGSTIFKHLLQLQMSHELIAKTTFAAAAVTFLVPAVTSNEVMIYVAFNVFEICCGVYFPAVGTIRSKVVPEATRSTVMNIFRVPLNLIVVVILLKVNNIPASLFFTICAGLCFVAFLFATRLVDNAAAAAASGSSGAYDLTSTTDDDLMAADF